MYKNINKSSVFVYNYVYKYNKSLIFVYNCAYKSKSIINICI